MTIGIVLAAIAIAFIAFAVHLFTRRRELIDRGQLAKPDDARLFARMVVSEIKLYREREVEAGWQNKDIYRRLQTDIDRARGLYNAQLGGGTADGRDYFYAALVEILARGDAARLGPDCPSR